MKKRKNKKSLAFLLICLLSFTVLCGCETVNGMKQDLRKLDNWIQETFW